MNIFKIEKINKRENYCILLRKKAVLPTPPITQFMVVWF